MALPPGVVAKTVTVGIASFFDGTLAEGTATITAPVNVIHTPTNRPIFSSTISKRFVDGEASFDLAPTDAAGLNRVDWSYKLNVVVQGALVQPDPIYFLLPTAGPDVVDLDALVTVPSSAGIPISVDVLTADDLPDQMATVAADETSAFSVAQRAASGTFTGDRVYTGVVDFTAAELLGIEGGGGTVPDASTTTKGIVEFATNAETTTGTDTTRAVTPAGVKAVADTKAAAAHTHGVADLTATGTKNATTFLRGDNTWATPEGGGEASDLVYDARDYGAPLGTDAAANTTGINAAIAAASAAGGGVVRIAGQGGTTRIHVTQIGIRAGVTLRGDGPGATLLHSASASTDVIVVDETTGSADQWTIEELKIEGGRDAIHATTTNNTNQLGYTRGVIRNVIALGCARTGFYIDTGCLEFRLENCLAKGCGDDGFRFQSTDHFVSHCTAQANATNGFRVNGANIHFTGCKAFGNAAGFVVTSRHQLANCDAQENTGDGFNVAGADCVLTGCLADSNGAVGFNVSSADNHTLVGCHTTSTAGLAYVHDYGFRIASGGNRGLVIVGASAREAVPLDPGSDKTGCTVDINGSGFANAVQFVEDGGTPADELDVLYLLLAPADGAPTAPGAPTIGGATGGDASASVAFTAPASDGGAAITGYRVTSSPGSITATGASSPITITGLTNATSYTFTVAATNSVGYGAESAASNSVTPAAAGGGGGGFTDTFDRADGSVGNGWTVVTGTAETTAPDAVRIVSNLASADPATVVQSNAKMFRTLPADGTITADLYGTNPWEVPFLLLRYIDKDNFVYIDNVAVKSVTAGVETEQGGRLGNPTGTSPWITRVEMAGSNIKVYSDDVLMTDTTVTAHQTATKHGIWFKDFAGTARAVDNWTFTP